VGVSRLTSPSEMATWAHNALANNDTCLRLLGEGPLDTTSARGLNLYRACRWHVGNGDAEWDGEQRVCSITEQGRETLARLEWRLANPEEAAKKDEAFFEMIASHDRIASPDDPRAAALRVHEKKP
jgi:hypothetical protein